MATVVQQTPAFVQASTPQTPKGNRNLILVIVAIVAVALVIGAVVAVAFFSSVASQPSIAITNTNTGQPQGQYDSSGNCIGETIPFSFELVNSGSADGFAHVVFLDNQTQQNLWNNNFLVGHGQTLPESASTFRSSCTAFIYEIRIASQWKA